MSIITEEVEETLAEIRELPSFETPHPEPISRHGFAGKISAVLKRMVAPHREYICESTKRYGIAETPIDILAREHPYVYIKALAG